MEGLLLLLFLFIAFSKGKKKPKKPVSKPDPQARQKAQKAAAVHNEQMRRQLRMDEFFPPYRPAAEEGYVSSEGMGQTEVYRGSLNAQSSEGECACDPSLEHEREAYSDPDSVYAIEIGDAAKLDFSPQGIMQGVVMSEILKRPAQRFRH